MVPFEILKEIVQETPSRIVFLILDGLGGLPRPETGKTELETARKPNLDNLARQSLCGLTEPVAPGITPGSGPSHLALFGYDPFCFTIGRGVLEACGIDLELEPGDVAARGNFCTVDSQGRITDRRAGRIASEAAAELCQLLSGISLEGAKLIVAPVKEHRFVILFRGEGLSAAVTETDPQQVGQPPREVLPLSPEAERTARLANRFVAQARAILNHRQPANMVLLRGFSQPPNLPSMEEVFRLKAAAIATYPMYRGLAKFLGMAVLPTGDTLAEEIVTLTRHYADFTFFYVHIKKTDAAGEDGDFDRKVHAIEEVDAALPSILKLKPDVLVVTGDHSTPALLAAHSWHPVPFLLYSRWCRPDVVPEFGERACAQGALGRFPATEIMPLSLAHALKLAKYGA